ncbi:glycosyltransferase family 4 protein [Bacillus mycoides]|uniref:glycosyltransferase family 4 protein n=1 Tax=Bacillus mycoides TaxID=1405 RepID=UPI002112E810|nr:glycosyltransferase family 4 protein [Bacillus mycoides]MCQ6534400.1 glycosyltransferase family 4 protein [Bacillus mycoides]
MKGLFCYDGPLSKDPEGHYHAVSLNGKVLSRYYHIADELTVAIRVKEVTDTNIINGLSKIELDNFQVAPCPNLSSAKGILFNRGKVRAILSREIKKADFLIVRLPSFIGNLSIDVARKMGKPYFVEVVGCPWDAFWNLGIKGKIIAPYMKFATESRVKEASHVVYVTKEFLQKRYPTKGENINCSNVALKDFDDVVLEKRLKHIEQQNHSKIIIGTTAAVNVSFKGQQYIMEALGDLKKKGINNFEYQLAGGGDQSYLKLMAEKYNVSEQVKFLGAIPHDKVFEWLDTIDIYAQPSRQEGLPRGLIEAMSRGIPALGARTAGIPELLENKFIFSNTKNNIDEICGILKSLDKETMLVQAKRNYIESKKYDREIIESRRRKFLKKFANSVGDSI